MSLNYAYSLSPRTTPQSEPILGANQIPNSAGGYTWPVDDWTRFDRFLVLGAEGGTYHIAERDLVRENHATLVRCIQADGIRAVNRLVEISISGRAPKNDPAILALALVATHGSPEAKTLAFQNLAKVCRIGTHLFHFAEYVHAMRGWGRGLRQAIGGWYRDQEADQLAYQAIKYQQRDHWSHGDLLRLAHPQAPSPEHEAVFRWICSGASTPGERTVKRKVNGKERVSIYPPAGPLPSLVNAFEMAKQATHKSEIVRLINQHHLPREAIPTRWLNDVAVWEALLQCMPLTAMLRNLGKMTAIGLAKPFSGAARSIVRKLGDTALLKRARIHPLAVLLALKVYTQGHGEKGSLTWQPVTQIIEALDDAFYATFHNVEPVGKPLLLALDVSGSMACSMIAGSSLSAREASAAMALVTAATEPEYEIIAFSAARDGDGGLGDGESGITRVALTRGMRLDAVIQKLSAIPMGGTDCALPMIWAARNQLRVSAFVTYTDCETWAGRIHPAQALRDYRQKFEADAKAVVVGLTANAFTLADPQDRGMLDVVGFDTTAPAVISDFVRS